MTQPAQSPPSQSPPDNPTAELLLGLGGVGLVALAMAHRRRQQRLALLLWRKMRTLWRFVDPSNPQGSWAAASPQAVHAMATVQAEAAANAAAYVGAVLRRQGQEPDPAGLVPAYAFSGVAADGRPLDSLLGYPAFEVSAFVDQGMDARQALGIGENHLKRIVVTEVADAARTSTSVAIANDRRTRGWVRMLTPPSCSRCVVLAGKWYAVNQGFERHPLCDCVHMPAAEVIDPPSPLTIFNAMTPAELKKAGWNDSDVAAIKDHGADLYQVTNAHRLLKTVMVGGQQLQATGHGGPRRRGQRKAVRLTPASIFSESRRLGWSRDELIRVLKVHGYIR